MIMQYIVSTVLFCDARKTESKKKRGENGIKKVETEIKRKRDMNIEMKPLKVFAFLIT